jgi:stearoyl-CoA desaturase (delta-9 desaturase)
MFSKSNFNWQVGVFLISYHIFLLVALPFYCYYCWPFYLPTVLTTIVLFFLTGLSITAGYHRLFSHRTYRANKIVEVLMLFFGSMAGQGSALRWCYDHRLHHAHVDTDEDPYSINKGFWYAHCLWLFEKTKPINPKIVSDLLANKLIVLQDRYFVLSMTVTNLIAFLGAGYLLQDYMGAFFLVVWVRLFLLHHSTWFINSLAHTWGDKPFCQEQSAVNNYVISFLTFGEGYHNYHHTFANDYRNGIRWYHFDPTKWLIWTLSKCGLANSLKKVDWYSIEKRTVMVRKQLLIEKLHALWNVEKENLERLVNELSDRLLLELATLQNLRERYYKLKKDCSEKDLLQQIYTELKLVQSNMKQDWQRWVQLSQSILHAS